MVEVYPCPLCGRVQNRHGKPFTTRSHTVGHIDGSRDDLHDGESGSAYRSEMEAEDVPEDELEPPEPSRSGGGGGSITTVSNAFMDGEEMGLADAVRLHGDVLAEPESFGLVSESEFAELEEKVERQEAVIHELMELVEILGGAVDSGDFKNALEARGEHGSEVYPWSWEDESLDMWLERYE